LPNELHNFTLLINDKYPMSHNKIKENKKFTNWVLNVYRLIQGHWLNTQWTKINHNQVIKMLIVFFM
jgi:hypothetical protein